MQIITERIKTYFLMNIIFSLPVELVILDDEIQSNNFHVTSIILEIMKIIKNVRKEQQSWMDNITTNILKRMIILWPQYCRI